MALKKTKKGQTAESFASSPRPEDIGRENGSPLRHKYFVISHLTELIETILWW